MFGPLLASINWMISQEQVREGERAANVYHLYNANDSQQNHIYKEHCRISSHRPNQTSDGLGAISNNHTRIFIEKSYQDQGKRLAIPQRTTNKKEMHQTRKINVNPSRSMLI